MSIAKRTLLVLLGVFFVCAGVSHFTQTAFFVEIVPPYLPAPLALVWASGVAEIALGALVLVPATRRLAAWGLIALLIAVFPANVHMALHHVQLAHAPPWMGHPSALALWLRLPVQGLLVAWAWWYTPD